MLYEVITALGGAVKGNILDAVFSTLNLATGYPHFHLAGEYHAVVAPVQLHSLV